MRNIKEWAKAAGIRALKTFAQTMIATIGTTALITEVNWSAAMARRRSLPFPTI